MLKKNLKDVVFLDFKPLKKAIKYKKRHPKKKCIKAKKYVFVFNSFNPLNMQ